MTISAVGANNQARHWWMRRNSYPLFPPTLYRVRAWGSERYADIDHTFSGRIPKFIDVTHYPYIDIQRIHPHVRKARSHAQT